MYTRQCAFVFYSLLIFILVFNFISCASTQESKLYIAAKNGDLKKLKGALNDNPSETEKDRACAIAIYFDNEKIFREILNSGISEKPYLSLRASVKKCDYVRLSSIVDTGIVWEHTIETRDIAFNAIKCKDSRIVKLLIDFVHTYLEIDPDYLPKTISSPNVSIAYKIYPFSHGYVLKGPEDAYYHIKTLLHMAIEENNIEVIKVMLDAGVDPKILNYLSVIKSRIIDYDRFPMTKLNSGWMYVFTKDIQSGYPSPCAPVSSNYKCNPTPEERTNMKYSKCLMFWREVGGSNSFVTDNCMHTVFQPYIQEPKIESEEMTPLMLAAYLGYAPTVKLLLEYGADVNVTNNIGKKAVDYAKGANRTDLLKLFDANY